MASAAHLRSLVISACWSLCARACTERVAVAESDKRLVDA